MSFAALPPEINSGLMYTGPGSGPILAAATAWDGFAAQGRATAKAYESIVQGLTSGSWLGPSSAAMAATAAPYIGWLTATAAQAETTATQARAAAAAYETAHAMVVSPPVITANRVLLIKLASTNVLGQNTAAIAAAEADYAGMWAQDGAAMDAYAGSAATAADVSAFSPPPTDNPVAPAAQPAAAAQAAGTGAQNALGQLASAVSTQAVPAPAAPPLQGLEGFLALPGLADIIGADVTSAIGIGVSGGAWAAGDESTVEILHQQRQLEDASYSILHAIDLFSPLTPSRPDGYIPPLLSPTAAFGEATSVGRLTVPASWTVAAPEIRPTAYTVPAPVAASPGLAGSMGTAFSEMSLAGMAGSAVAGTVKGSGRQERGSAGARQQVKPPQKRAAGPEAPSTSPPVSPLVGVAAEIREFAELRDAGILSDDEFQAQKRRLLGQ